MRARRATAHSENRNQVMPYGIRLHVSTCFNCRESRTGEVRGVCVTRKVLCESWVAESRDDAIVRALSTSHGRSGGRSHEEISDAVRGLVTKDQFVGGHLASDRGETRGNQNVGDAKGTEPPSRSAGRAANPCAPEHSHSSAAVLLRRLEHGEVVFWGGCDPSIWKCLPGPACLLGLDWLRIA